jgi:hypothetical protein
VEAQSVHREKVRIVTGPTVQVSRAFPDLPNYENLAVGDPEHPGRLMTCSMVYPEGIGTLCQQYCYVSFDGGKTWDPSLKVTEGKVNGDPTAVYAHGDTVYVVALVIKDLEKPKDPEPSAPRDEAKTVVYKSTDGGRTFAESARFQFIDREFIDIDRTTAPPGGSISWDKAPSKTSPRPEAARAFKSSARSTRGRRSSDRSTPRTRKGRRSQVWALERCSRTERSW